MRPPTKRRKIAVPARVEEISFNPESREEYLTGFHKRKVQRAKHAQEAAEKRAKEERREARKQIREERKAEFEEALKRHRAEMEALNGFPSTVGGDDDSEDRDDGEEWNGIIDPPPVDYEAEYIDEDKYTTVTVEEIEATKGGLVVMKRDVDGKPQDKDEAANTEDEDEDDEEKKEKEKVKSDGKGKGKKIWTKENPNKENRKKRKKKRDFKYESPLERKLNRAKERGKKKKQADARKASKG
ncbi:rRNA processing protein Rrp17 [Arthroderma uncinatum]|uniref:rRNA processing protein Rrp17 n=1 Tax=Arthroderma uncinatum TaxID=74035 RepID=UPI00144A9849|nr:rRNA processing protein Rrp17 [Arthroderma uncinatum]KAF3481800.1 rRNA processing protein Rrp17 [Arthroderma uncinatum]